MKKFLRRVVYGILAVFVLLNIITIFHAYKFTHYVDGAPAKPQHLSAAQKAGVLFFGFDNPRPVNDHTPTQHYETVKIKSNVTLECWSIKADSAKGTVIIFHGYGGKKAGMIDKSDELLKMGYNTLLVDFMGSGGSEGNQTTIGYKEAEEVKDCFEYVAATGEKNIYLLGISMGAAAILKALHDYPIQPKAIVIECPYGTMRQAIGARFRLMGVPEVPMANLLLFWGGAQNGFNAYRLNPADYAKAVKCPALHLYGGEDKKVGRDETDAIYANLQGPKQLKIYPYSGHENYLLKYHDEWVEDVGGFISKH